MESRKAVKYAKAFREVDVCEVVHEFRKLRPHLTDILNGKVLNFTEFKLTVDGL